MLKSLAFIAIASYVGLAVLLWLLQEKLLFHPQPVFARAHPPAGWAIEDVAIAARDGTRLAGVLVKPPGPPAALVIYYGGNAEEVTGGASEAYRYGRRAHLLVNYRGYGRSEGTPTEQALVADALDVFDWATGRRDIDAARIALHGSSLGSGVAVQAAAQRPVKAVILTSPYDSIRDVAKRRFPYMPIAWILRHPFDSMIHAPKLKAPALVLFGTGDTMIFREQSERLAGLWGGSVERVALEGRDHNDVASDPRYFPAISGFLDRHL